MTQHTGDGRPARRFRRSVRIGLAVALLGAILATAGAVVGFSGAARAAARTAPPVVHAAKHSDIFQVTFQTEQFPIPCPPQNPTFNLCIGFTGTGNATVLGATSISRSADGVFDPNQDTIPFVSNGTLTARGGTLNFLAAGQYTISIDVAKYVFVITGGTGKFRHAEGTGTITVPFTGTHEPEIWSGTLDVH
ncbi:MAG: hypothetical protein ACRDHP_01885 [Ktedonobacterales bacterium]